MTFNINVQTSLAPLPAGLEQSFSTIPLPNLRQALYTLSVRAPDQSQTEVASYTFPISPANLTREITTMTNFYDVQGSSIQQGVQRQADLYGNTPATFTLQGTTGWQFHATDGGTFTGLDSIFNIINLLEQFAEFNQIQSDSNQNPYTLEFYDYFTGEFWQIVPVGRQGIRQSERRPLLFEYYFRFAGIRPLDAPPTTNINDPIAQDFSTPAPQAQSACTGDIGSLLSSYSDNTPAGSIILGRPVLDNTQ